jgi:hypothetical protein
VAGVHHGRREVYFLLRPEAVQQDLVDRLPDPGLLPGVQIPPTTHPASAAHLLGQVLPGDACLEHEQDSRQSLATVQRLAAGILEPARLGRGKERFDHAPQFVVQ